MIIKNQQELEELEELKELIEYAEKTIVRSTEYDAELRMRGLLRTMIEPTKEHIEAMKEDARLRSMELWCGHRIREGSEL